MAYLNGHTWIVTNLEPNILECEVKLAFRKYLYEQS